MKNKINLQVIIVFLILALSFYSCSESEVANETKNDIMFLAKNSDGIDLTINESTTFTSEMFFEFGIEEIILKDAGDELTFTCITFRDVIISGNWGGFYTATSTFCCSGSGASGSW